MLPLLRSAVGPDVPLLDSGIRSGSYIVVALRLGTDFVLNGRATRYGATAGRGEAAEFGGAAVFIF